MNTPRTDHDPTDPDMEQLRSDVGRALFLQPLGGKKPVRWTVVIDATRALAVVPLCV